MKNSRLIIYITPFVSSLLACLQDLLVVLQESPVASEKNGQCFEKKGIRGGKNTNTRTCLIVVNIIKAECPKATFRDRCMKLYSRYPPTSCTKF